MRKVEDLTIRYQGYEHPINKDEIEFEIAGLQLAIACAEQRIKILEQSTKLYEMMEKDKNKRTNNDKII